jgi:uncharacterized protein
VTLHSARWLAAPLCLLLLAFSTTVAYRNYRAARNLVAKDPPSPLLKDPGAAGVRTPELVAIASGGVLVKGWYVPSENGALIIVCHGTNSDRTSMLDEIRLLSSAGFGVMAFDWPGLGESGGAVHWGAEAEDALTNVTSWVDRRSGPGVMRLGGLGFSIGGYMLTRVAARDLRFQAIVVESAPTDFSDYVDVHYGKWGILSKWPARLAMRDTGLLSGPSAQSVIAGLSPRPLLLIAQSEDPETPLSMTRELERAAGSPKQLWVIDGHRHGSYGQAAGEEYGRRLVTFFRDSLLR